MTLKCFSCWVFMLIFPVFVFSQTPQQDEKTKKWGCVDNAENWLIKPIFNNVELFKDKGLAFKNSLGQWAIYDFNGNKIIDYGDKIDDLGIWYLDDEDTPSDENGTWYVKNGLFGLLNTDGEIITQPLYEEQFPIYSDIYRLVWENGLLKARKNGKYGFINTSGKEVISLIYENIGSPISTKDDLFGKYEELSQNEKSIIELIPAKLNAKWGFIDKNGNSIIDFQFFEVENFDVEIIDMNKMILAKVILNNDKLTNGYIDAKGNFKTKKEEFLETPKIK